MKLFFGKTLTKQCLYAIGSFIVILILSNLTMADSPKRSYFKVWWADAQQYVFKEPEPYLHLIEQRRQGPITAELASGETEPVQIVLTPNFGQQFTRVRLKLHALKAVAGEGEIPAAALDWQLVRYLNGKWPDVLVPKSSFATAPGGKSPQAKRYNYSMWVRINVPQNTPPGFYEGPVDILAKRLINPQKPLSKQESVSTRRTLRVLVYGFSLAPGSNMETALYGIRTDHLNAMYGFKRGGEEERKYIQQICDSLAAHRIAHGNDTLSPIPDRRHDVLSPEGKKVFLAWCQYWRTKGLGLGTIRPQAGAFGQRFWGAYYNLFKQRGWIETAWEQHRDEFNTPEGAQRAQAYAKKIRALAPGLRIMATAIGAGRDVHEAAIGAVDIWGTELGIYNSLRSFFRKRLDAGEQVFWYVHHHLRFPTDPLALRSLFWSAWNEGVTGTVLYSVNGWGRIPSIHMDDQGIWQDKTYAGYPLGGGVLFWPGPQGPLESVRLEWLRDGIEDWEYLRLLHKLKLQADQKGYLTADMLKQVDQAVQAHQFSDPVRHLYPNLGADFSHNGYGIIDHPRNSKVLYNARRQVAKAIEMLTEKLNTSE